MIPIPAIPDPEDFAVSLRTGFLPAEPPLETLPDSYYASWENVIRNLHGLLLSKRLREVVHGLPVLATDRLHSLPQWRRAYSVLAFLTHAYIWGGSSPAEVVPPAISIPFLSVCEHLELPPVTTYAACVLWNYKPLFDEPSLGLDNLVTLATFTGSLDESWFYLVSVAIEARGGTIISLMLDAMQAVRDNDSERVADDLIACADRLSEITALLQRMYDNCDPHVFYHRIRPFLAGSKNMADAGLPNGVKFDTGAGDAEYVHLAGGSNAQSSLIQFFDIALDIEHLPTGERRGSTALGSTAEARNHPSRPGLPGRPSQNFITDMRRYMPGPHRRFLERVAQVANIREYVELHGRDERLTVAYDACLGMLQALRNTHLQIVSRYIIVKSREVRSLGPHQPLQQSEPGLEAEIPASIAASSSSSLPAKSIPTSTSAVSAAAAAAARKKCLRGTGGTELISFLKQARDETSQPAFGTWVSRILTDASYRGFALLNKVDDLPTSSREVVGHASSWCFEYSEGGICHC